MNVLYILLKAAFLVVCMVGLLSAAHIFYALLRPWLRKLARSWRWRHGRASTNHQHWREL